jgi:signal transduction histidine kinase
MEAPDPSGNCRIDTDVEQRISVTSGFGIVVGALASGLLGAALGRALSGDWGPASLAGAMFGSVCLVAGAALAPRARVPARTGTETGAEAEPSDAVPPTEPRNVAGARAEEESVLRSFSHDLRSPLGAVVNFASVLEQDHGEQLDEEARRSLARIRRAAHSALALLEGFTRLSRAACEPLRPRRVDAEALAREAFASLPPTLRPAELSLGALPPAFADPALLRACFAELLANAAKFSGGREKAQVAVGGRREPDGGVVYWVADEGVGFDSRYAARLFRAFERLHPRDEFPGAGVGLAIVRQAAERHGGRVWAEGEPGGGARFYLALPAGQEAA